MPGASVAESPTFTTASLSEDLPSGTIRNGRSRVVEAGSLKTWSPLRSRFSRERSSNSVSSMGIDRL